jgi:hypothetical protein
MGLFDKLTTAVGIGGAKVELGVEAGNHQEGAFATGTVLVKGGKTDQVCDGLSVEVRQWRDKVEVVNGESKTVQHKETLVMKNLAPAGFAIKPGSDNIFQFRIYLPSQGKTEIVASADIPGAIDPSATAKIEVGPGRQGFLPRTVLKRVDGKVGAKDISRIGGKPIGIDAKNWPMHEGKALSHLMTIDLHTLDLPFVPRNRALAVFCLNPDDNGAYEPGNPFTRVVLISPQDIKKGEPAEVPAHPQLTAAKLETAPLTNQDPMTFFGGVPKYIQGDPFESHDFSEGLQKSIESGGFYCQFDESLVPMNLGDSGVMYVFERTAFWQCS